MSDIEWSASELQAEVDRLRAELDEQRERIDSARHALSGGLTIRHYREESERLREEKERRLKDVMEFQLLAETLSGKNYSLNAKLAEERAENARLCAENTCLENSAREMQATIKRLECELGNARAELRDYQSREPWTLDKDGGKVDALRAKLAEEQTENARLAAVNETLENTIKAMTGNLNWIVESNAQAVRERDDHKAKLTEALAEVSRLARAHLEAVEAGRSPGRLLGYAPAAHIGAGGGTGGSFNSITPVSHLCLEIDDAKAKPSPSDRLPGMIVAVYEVRP